jgi:hypothetical protein
MTTRLDVLDSASAALDYIYVRLYFKRREGMGRDDSNLSSRSAIVTMSIIVCDNQGSLL